MTIFQWFICFLVLQVIHFLGTWKLYKKAGRQAWEAIIPVYNAFVLMRIINRPWWWVFLLFIPVVNLIMFPVVWVETIRSFGRHSKTDTWLVILSLGLYIFYVNYALDNSYIKERSLKPRTAAGEWVSSILFAIVAATLVHNYFIQPFVIPTSSMEKTLLVGDFLFVSKFHYGARPPMTTVSAPLVHDTLPGLGIKSYTSWPQFPYFRLPGLTSVQRKDIVVFNWPVDTVNAFKPHGDGQYYYKPIDKKSNYVKRCVGIPGDSLSIVDGKVYINDTPLELSDRAKTQTSYKVTTKHGGFNRKYLYDQYNYTERVHQIRGTNNQYIFTSLTQASAKKLAYNPNVEDIEKLIRPKGKEAGTFPNSTDLSWNIDNYGPIYIPEKGKTVPINPQSLPFYKRIIEVYEGAEMGIDRKLTTQDGQVFLNGSPIDSYTFKQNYYWMMGDNRHNSEDSRFWGYVPENHIVGKPIFIWMSIDNMASGFNKIRWDRVFTTVSGKGKPISFLPYFLIAVVIIFAFIFFRKRQKRHA